jgi:hypothetical protein
LTQPTDSRAGLGNQTIHRSRSAYRRLTGIGFPRRFPIIQFPNLPLVTAFVAGWARDLVSAADRPYLTSVSYLAMTVWAYEELVHGSNWFRRQLGAAFMVILTVRVAHSI